MGALGAMSAAGPPASRMQQPGRLGIHTFILAALVVIGLAILAASAPAMLLSATGASEDAQDLGGTLTAVLLTLIALALTVPNVLIHIVRRLTVHHRGARRVVWHSLALGEGRLRARISEAFADSGLPPIDPAEIEGLE